MTKKSAELLLLAVLCSDTAHAHSVLPLSLRIGVGIKEVRLSLRMSWTDPAEASALVEQFDRDGSGRLDRRELTALIDYAVKQASRGLSVFFDEQARKCSLASNEVSVTDSVAIRLSCQIPLDGKSHRVRISARNADGKTQVPYELIVHNGRHHGRVERGMLAPTASVSFDAP